MFVKMNEFTGDAFGEDDEVYLYMKDKIRHEVCLCKKYGKGIKRKSCTFCYNSHSKGEPKIKPRKCCGIPTGNYGRTGCLAKPDLCTIPEHDLPSHVTDEPAHGSATRSKNRNKTCITELKRKHISDIASVSAQQVACIGNHFKPGNATNKHLTGTWHARNKDTVLLNATDNIRIRFHVAVEERVKLKEPTAKLNTPNSNNERNNKRLHFQSGSQKPGDAKSVNRANDQCSWRRRKPNLIPAREFIDRYLPPPPSKRKVNENETPELGSLKDDVTNGDKDDATNATDDQKIIDGLSRISINTSNFELTDNDKCIQK